MMKLFYQPGNRPYNRTLLKPWSGMLALLFLAVLLLVPGGPVMAAPNYTVAYDGNGNDGGTAPTDSSSPYQSGAAVTVLGNSGGLTKSGYDFVGWNTAADGSGTSYGEGATFTITGDVTLYAVWNQPPLAGYLTVSYDGNGNDGGTAPADSSSPYQSGATVSVLGNSGGLTKGGYDFAGWNTAADGSGTSYGEGATFTIADNVTLYAVWNLSAPPAATYTVAYDGNGNDGGTAPADISSPYQSGATVSVLGNSGGLTKSGYDFAGWNTAANGSGTSYQAGATFNITSNIILYAQWNQLATIPAVSGISPNNGPEAGGTSVTITGTSFTGASSVKFGSNDGTNLIVVSDTSITVTSPAGTGQVDVTVTTPGGTSAPGPGDMFTYQSSAKDITAFTVPGQVGSSTIDSTNHTVSFHMPNGASVSALAPTITVSANATVTPTSGTAQDFSSPVTYTVTAQDGSSQNWIFACIVDPPSSIYIVTTLSSGFNEPCGLAVDSSGNIYVADTGNSAVKKINSNDNSITPLGTGFSNPSGVAVDSSGNIYVADTGNSAVKKINSNDNSIIPLGTGFSNPSGVAVDSSGNIYVGDTGNKAIKKMDSSGNNITPQGSGFNDPIGVAVDSSGNIYVADDADHAVKRVDPSGHITPLGSGFTWPCGVAVDSSGNIYVADTGNDAVKKIDSSGNISILGSGFSNPIGVAVDSSGNIYVADYGNNAIKKITKSTKDITAFIVPGQVGASDIDTTNHTVSFHMPGGADVSALAPAITVSANATVSPTSGTVRDFGSPVTYTVTAQDGSAQNWTAACIVDPPVTTIGPSIDTPSSIAVDNSGNIYIADYWDSAIIRMDSNGNNVVTLGSGFSEPHGVAVDNSGNIYVADTHNNSIKRMDSSGNNIVPLGSGFREPHGVAVDSSGNIYVADTWNSAVKRMDSSGNNVTPLGSGFQRPEGVAVDSSGNIYVADTMNSAVKRMDSSGNNITPLGSGFQRPQGVAVDSSGNIYVADTDNNAVKSMDSSGNHITPLGSGFDGPCGVAVDCDDNIYIADTGNRIIKKITASANPVATDKDITALTVSGQVGSSTYIHPTNHTATFHMPNGSDVSALAPAITLSANATVAPASGTVQDFSNPVTYTVTAQDGSTQNWTVICIVDPVTYTFTILGSGFNEPEGVAVDGSGNIYVSDTGNDAVKKMDSGGNVIKTFSIDTPYGVAVDSSGNIYVAEYVNGAINKINPNDNSITILGTGFSRPSGVALDGSGNIYVSCVLNNTILKINPNNNTVTYLSSSDFNRPYGIAVDNSGNIYVADTDNNAVKKLNPNDNSITPLGSGFAYPHGVAVDSSGNIYVADASHSVIKRMNPNGSDILTLGSSIATLDSGFNFPNGVAVDNSGNIYVADTENNAIKKITKSIPVNSGSNDATLSNLVVSAGSFNETFDSNATVYTVNVADGVTTTTITPTVNESHATVKVNGTTVNSGAASGNIQLNAGVNTIAVVVTGQNGTTTKTYTITINRAAPAAAPVFLSAATSSGGTKIIITFDKDMMTPPPAAPAGFTVSVNGAGDPVTGVARGTNTTTLELTLGTPIVSGQTVTVSYTPGPVISADGGILAAFSNRAVTNNSPASALTNIAITRPAAKLSYYVGQTLDISGLEVTGTYSDGSTNVQNIAPSNVTGFDSSVPAASQTLTITVNGKTAAYTVIIIATPQGGGGGGGGGGSKTTKPELVNVIIPPVKAPPKILQPPAPVITPDGGFFDQEQTVSITNIAPGASAFYTCDGSDPTTNRQAISYNTPFKVGESADVKAAVYDGDNGVWSAVTTSALVIKVGPITRGETMAILAAGLNLPSYHPATPYFSDVQPGSPDYDYIEAAVHSGAISRGSGSFRPDDAITREELAVILVGVLGRQKEAQNGQNSQNSAPGFNDDGDIASWARGAVAVASQYGIMGAYNQNNDFMPGEQVTAAEAKAIINQFLNKYVPTYIFKISRKS
ncbi:MAG: InlB B-repeat-containing protein [Syntrophomonadaceae bacterium]